MRARILKASIEVTDRLAELGLHHGLFVTGIKAGEVARATCTRNDPSNAGGTLAFFRTIRSLRESLIPKGWQAIEPNGLPLVANLNGGIAIAISTGDQGTGFPDREVKTKYSKGDATQAVLDEGREYQLALDLGPIAYRTRFPKKETPRFATWYLLRHRVKNVVHFEFSLPVEIGSKGRISVWKERLFFPSIAIEPVLDDLEAQNDDTVEEIDVAVERI